MTILKHYQLNPYAGDVGIEIEVEGRNLPQRVNLWRGEHDGSLRGEAMEYVTRNGVAAKDVDKTIDSIIKAFKDSVVNDSARAGVHVHVNIQDMTHTQVASFATLYYIFENVLTEWCGGFREGNLFCLRTDDADYITNMVVKALQYYNLRELQTDMVRYSALNWKPATMYGSLEFRQMRTPKDFTLVSKWVKMLLQVKEASKRYKEPRDIISEWSMSTPKDFLNDHMGEFAKDLMFDNYEDKMLNGMFNAQDIAFCVDWDGYEANFRTDDGKRAKGIKDRRGLDPAMQAIIDAAIHPRPQVIVEEADEIGGAEWDEPVEDEEPRWRPNLELEREAKAAAERILKKRKERKVANIANAHNAGQPLQRVVFDNNQWKLLDKDEF